MAMFQLKHLPASASEFNLKGIKGRQSHTSTALLLLKTNSTEGQEVEQVHTGLLMSKSPSHLHTKKDAENSLLLCEYTPAHFEAYASWHILGRKRKLYD